MSDIQQAQLEFLRTIDLWLADNYRVLLVTVIATKGTTPRELGSQFALREDGLFVGSVSGGCAEDALIAFLKEKFPDQPGTVFYGGGRIDARSSLACGGEIELALEPLTDNKQLHEIITVIQAGRQIQRRYHLENGQTELLEVANPLPFYLDHPWLTVSYGFRWRLLIIGAVEIAHHLIPIAQMLNYRVEVCDPRQGYRNAWRLTSTGVDSDYPDDWLMRQSIDEHCAIVALSHDPRVDDMALMTALCSSAFYVGVLGSKRGISQRHKRLQQLDLTDEQISRLQAPVGLDIGSRSAAEIAVSICARLIQIRQQLNSHA